MLLYLEKKYLNRHPCRVKHIVLSLAKRLIFLSGEVILFHLFYIIDLVAILIIPVHEPIHDTYLVMTINKCSVLWIGMLTGCPLCRESHPLCRLKNPTVI